MSNSCKYYKEQEYVSNDSGATWVATSNYRKGDLIEAHSSDCGYDPIYKWERVTPTSDPNSYLCNKCNGDECITQTNWFRHVFTNYHCLTVDETYITLDGGKTWTLSESSTTGQEDDYFECVATEYAYQYLTFVCRGSGRLYFTTSLGWSHSFQYSKDGGLSWRTLESRQSIDDARYISCNTGDRIIMKGDRDSTGEIPIFYTNFSVDLEGNPRSLIDNDNFASPSLYDETIGTIMSIRNVTVVNAQNLFLYKMDCSNMFANQTSLVTVPKLFKVSTNCSGMFSGCTSLTSVPSDMLPATLLTDGCYENMFINCTNLYVAPELPATALTNGCYNRMFSGCTSLREVTCYATQFYGDDMNTSTYGWLNNVSSNGTFKCTSQEIWANNIPQGWSLIEI